MTEEWRKVEGFEYEVSNLGRVRRIPQPLKHQIGSNGYPMVHLMLNGAVGKRKTIHRLVCEAFHGPPPTPKSQVRHKDGDRVNNSSENLLWGTSLENHADRRRHGRIPAGQHHGNARLTDVQVQEIRDLAAMPRKRGETDLFIRRMMESFPVSYTTVEEILYDRGRFSTRHTDTQEQSNV